MSVQVGAGVLCERLGVDLSDRSFLKRRVGKPDSRARGGIHTWFGRFVLARFFSPHLRRLRELVWVGGCVTVPVAWASGPSTLASRGPWGRRCRGTRDTARSRESGLVARRPGAGTCGVGLPPGAKSVHRLAKTASWSCFGPFVYTVAPLWTDVGTQECTQIGGNGLSTPFRGICVHCCAVADNRGYARVYTDWHKWTLDAVSGHLCTLLRRDSPRRQPTRTPEEPKMFPDWRSRRGRRAALYARDRQLLSSSTSSRISSMAASGLVCRSE